MLEPIPEGSDSIQTAVLAIKHGVTTKELGETIFPYLATVEGLKLARAELRQRRDHALLLRRVTAIEIGERARLADDQRRGGFGLPLAATGALAALGMWF